MTFCDSLLGLRLRVRIIPANPRSSSSESVEATARIMSSRSPGVMMSTPFLNRCRAFCTPIAPTRTSWTELFNSSDWLSTNQFHRGLGKDRLVRHDAEQFQAFAFQTAPGKFREIG